VSEKKSETNKWNGWFRPLANGKKLGAFVVTLVEIQVNESKGDKRSHEDLLREFKRRRIIISVPKTCGSAVVRNRLRRVLRPLVNEAIEAHFGKCSASQSFAIGTGSKKGIWIRVVKGQRLGSQMWAKKNKAEVQEFLDKGIKAICSQLSYASSILSSSPTSSTN